MKDRTSARFLRMAAMGCTAQHMAQTLDVPMRTVRTLAKEHNVTLTFRKAHDYGTRDTTTGSQDDEQGTASESLSANAHDAP